MKSTNTVRGLLARAPLATAVAVALLAAPAAQAFEFQKGGLTGSLDTTVSYGISVRTEDQDEDLIGKAQFDPAHVLPERAARRDPARSRPLLLERRAGLRRTRSPRRAASRSTATTAT